MRPDQLTADSFRQYPPEAKALAVSHLALLQTLPLSFLPLLLRELIVYDWKFPAERQDLDRQLRFLTETHPTKLLDPFVALHLKTELESVDWVNVPAEFSEELSAYLWSSHQIDAFRKAAVDYVHGVESVMPLSSPPTGRLTMVVAGAQANGPKRPLFRNLQPHGVYYTNVSPGKGLPAFFDALNTRAKSHPDPFAHWYIDGDRLQANPAAGFTAISYADLHRVRESLQSKMLKAMSPRGGGPELLRSQLQRMQPSEVGLQGPPVLTRFQLTLLTEGSGTQIFSTSFVQWAARESLRRSQPVTLLARFTPRRREAAISAVPGHEDLDPEASLIDAEMGAYYTWINGQRLAGAADAKFLVWHEAHAQAVAIGPGFARDTQDHSPVTVEILLSRLQS